MDVESGSEPKAKNRTTVERASDRELVVTRAFDAPARIVFDAWTKPELLMRWWAPRSFGISLTSCEVDLRVGGKYRLVFAAAGRQEHVFFGSYKEVVRPSRLVWTDEEQTQGGGEAVTTVTFTETQGKTLVVMRQLFVSKDALDENLKMGVDVGTRETFEQLDALVATIV